MGPSEVVKTDHADWKKGDAVVADGSSRYLSLSSYLS
jgi:hypothetical protein